MINSDQALNDSVPAFRKPRVAELGRSRAIRPPYPAEGTWPRGQIDPILPVCGRSTSRAGRTMTHSSHCPESLARWLRGGIVLTQQHGADQVANTAFCRLTVADAQRGGCATAAPHLSIAPTMMRTRHRQDASAAWGPSAEITASARRRRVPLRHRL
jgi:hypothetical protein